MHVEPEHVILNFKSPIYFSYEFTLQIISDMRIVAKSNLLNIFVYHYFLSILVGCKGERAGLSHYLILYFDCSLKMIWSIFLLFFQFCFHISCNRGMLRSW